MKSITRVKILRILAYILILISFESQAQVTGIHEYKDPFEQRSIANNLSQQPSTAKNPTKSTTKAKKSKKKSSKSTTKAKKSKKKSSSNRSASNKSDAPPTFVYIDPIRDLGINKGYVCFRIKAYSNIEVSDFSRAVCGYIKNSKKIKLAWTPRSNSVIGYHVYFGTSAKITKKFITDVM